MDFTREPIIQTVITPREGYKIVVRSSKNMGQEEYFVESVELVSFTEGLFFRSQERPKPFLVPASDYEVIEVRETKMVLKNVGLDRSIKIAGGKESSMKPKEEPRREEEPSTAESADKGDRKGGGDRKRDRRRDKRRRGRPGDETPQEAAAKPHDAPNEGEISISAPILPAENELGEPLPAPSPLLSSLLTPPPALIADTLRDYRNSGLFKEAFYSKEELHEVGGQKQEASFALHPPSESEFEVFEEKFEEKGKGEEGSNTLS